jgi:hypothetical protein
MVPPPATGTLLVRAWFEEGRLKARVMRTVDGETETMVVAGGDAVLAVIEAWIARLAAQDGPDVIA